MEVIHERCVGMDISKRDAKVCVRTVRPREPTASGSRWMVRCTATSLSCVII